MPQQGLIMLLRLAGPLAGRVPQYGNRNTARKRAG